MFFIFKYLEIISDPMITLSLKFQVDTNIIIFSVHRRHVSKCNILKCSSLENEKEWVYAYK